MGYEVHIIRQTDSGEEVDITLDECNRFIESDADFTHPPVGNINYGKNLFCLPTDSSDPDDWPWMAWTNGRIHSKHGELSVMKKLGQMARAFGAVMMSDDGDLWSIDEEGRVSIQAFLEPVQGWPRPQRCLQEFQFPDNWITHFFCSPRPGSHSLGSSARVFWRGLWMSTISLTVIMAATV